MTQVLDEITAVNSKISEVGLGTVNQLGGLN